MKFVPSIEIDLSSGADVATESVAVYTLLRGNHQRTQTRAASESESIIA